jgi:hypothetical protein
MIVKALARKLFAKQNLFNFTKAATSTGTQTIPPTSPITSQQKRGQISQVIGAVVDVQF